MINEIEEIQKKINHILNYGGSLKDVEELMDKQIELVDRMIEGEEDE